MGETVILDDVYAYLDGADLALTMTKCELNPTLEEKDVTTFRVGTPAASVANSAKLVRGGLESAALKIAGFADSGSTADVVRTDDLFRGRLGSRDTVVTIAPNGGTLGSTAYLAESTLLKVGTALSPGEVWPYDVEGHVGLVIKGQVALPTAAVTASGTGSSVNIAVTPAGGRLHASLHCVATSGGGSVDVIVESSVDDTFASPTTVLTFSTVTGTGGWLKRTARGAVTDTYFRFTFTATLDPAEYFVLFGAIGYE